ncbi:polysaccharide pyruvyl transferase family protein [Anaerotruncus colihominis]|uniref:Polysaccharide pyruvyl transferase domain-containing protein n=1 Tax=Anaerotruncus colihominis TaxID=169435 RepID=A0A845RK64_9FIRM|nr:polysaccharide pyruvyl transferase family protein [Anaerotruncus colihominis]NBI80114.1 hypothetical protein [Anaerotruncus colihominis]
MRYGLVVYQDSANLGDDIQSYAAIRFLPRVDEYIEREELDAFYPEQEQPIAVIMNGWYLYQHYNWPPSPYIIPFFIGTHFDTFYSWEFRRRITENHVFDGVGAKYLLQNGPVGARDQHTLKLLQKYGIDAYYSACLTLSISPFEDVEKGDYICLVDVSPEIEAQIRSMTDRPIRIMSHYMELKTLSVEERMRRVESYLRIYQGAHCVITTRLHCALPCLALETPVFVIYSEWMKDRLETYLPYFHHVNYDQAGQDFDISKAYDLENPPPNPMLYKKDRVEQERQCGEFIKKVETHAAAVCPEMIYRTSLERLTQLKEEVGREIEARLSLEELSSSQQRQLEQLQQLQAYNQSLCDEKEQMRQTIANLNTCIEMTEKKVQAAQTAWEQASEQLQIKEAELGNLQKENESQKRMITQQHREKQELADTLCRIYMSKFWKLAQRVYAIEGFFIRMFKRS